MINALGFYFLNNVIFVRQRYLPQELVFQGAGGQQVICPRYKCRKMGIKVYWAVMQQFRSLNLTLVTGNLTEAITKIQNNNMPPKVYRLISTTFLPENETFSTHFGTTMSN